jgi:hypothetical protein
MDHYSYLIDHQHRNLLVGIILLIIAVVFTLIGESLEFLGPIASRAEEPKRFWRNVALFYIGGVFYIALYWFNNSK